MEKKIFQHIAIAALMFGIMGTSAAIAKTGKAGECATVEFTMPNQAERAWLPIMDYVSCETGSIVKSATGSVGNN